MPELPVHLSSAPSTHRRTRSASADGGLTRSPVATMTIRDAPQRPRTGMHGAYAGTPRCTFTDRPLVDDVARRCRGRRARFSAEREPGQPERIDRVGRSTTQTRSARISRSRGELNRWPEQADANATPARGGMRVDQEVAVGRVRVQADRGSPSAGHPQPACGPREGAEPVARRRPSATVDVVGGDEDPRVVPRATFRPTPGSYGKP